MPDCLTVCPYSNLLTKLPLTIGILLILDPVVLELGRSTSQIKVNGHRMKMFLFFLAVDACQAYEVMYFMDACYNMSYFRLFDEFFVLR